jgi:transcriptional regulator GlxA family with amidase domain
MSPTDDRRRVSVVLFDGFELLDVFGPLEMFGKLSESFVIETLGPEAAAVTSAQGVRVLADVAYRDASLSEVVLVPGGIGTRVLARDPVFLAWLAEWATPAEFVTSVCTGSGLLAAAGLLDGYKATSNKRAFAWASSQGTSVEWIFEARWVEDRNRWTSSGVAAGMDMALALIGHLHGSASTDEVAESVEYGWHQDASWDPFAAKARDASN